MAPPRWVERPAVCPSCETVRATKAAPRTRLVCRSCHTSFLAPDATPAPTPAPTTETPAPSGVKVVDVKEIKLRKHLPAPAAKDPTPADPKPDDPPPADPPADPPAEPPEVKPKRRSSWRRPCI